VRQVTSRCLISRILHGPTRGSLRWAEQVEGGGRAFFPGSPFRSITSAGKILTHREGMLFFFTPKGWHFSAQGNALGTGAPPTLLHPEGVAFFSPGQRPGNGSAAQPISPERAPERLPAGACRALSGLMVPFCPLPRAMPAMPWAEKCHPFGVKKGATPRRE
jgi:hypothetical protein